MQYDSQQQILLLKSRSSPLAGLVQSMRSTLECGLTGPDRQQSGRRARRRSSDSILHQQPYGWAGAQRVAMPEVCQRSQCTRLTTTRRRRYHRQISLQGRSAAVR